MRLETNSIHVWSAKLQLSTLQTKEVMATLSADEILRAKSFSLQASRDNFIASRYHLRYLLATYLSCNPHEVHLSYDTYRKPKLASLHASSLQFNLSHSAGLAVYAFRQSHPVGIDIEKIADHAYLALARRFLSPEESQSLEALPAALQKQSFYGLWSRKEALLKATGRGLSGLLSTFSLPIQHEASSLNFEQYQWEIIPLLISAGYTSALATEAPVGSINYFMLSK